MDIRLPYELRISNGEFVVLSSQSSVEWSWLRALHLREIGAQPKLGNERGLGLGCCF